MDHKSCQVYCLKNQFYIHFFIILPDRFLFTGPKSFCTTIWACLASFSNLFWAANTYSIFPIIKQHDFKPILLRKSYLLFFWNTISFWHHIILKTLVFNSKREKIQVSFNIRFLILSSFYSIPYFYRMKQFLRFLTIAVIIKIWKLVIIYIKSYIYNRFLRQYI